MTARNASPEQLAWERECSPHITSDTIWKLEAYRSALFLIHLAKVDVKLAAKDRTRVEVAAQLLGAAGGIGAHIGEGYSRATRADRLRFLGYALGSIRECTAWYLAISDVLGSPADVESRFALLARVRAMVFGMIRAHRRAIAARKGPGFEV